MWESRAVQPSRVGALLVWMWLVGWACAALAQPQGESAPDEDEIEDAQGEEEAPPAHQSPRLRRAEQLMKRGLRAAAARALEEVVRAHPEDEEARRELARAWLRLGKHDQARQELERLAQIHPGDVSLAQILARAWLLSGSPAEAVRVLEESVPEPGDGQYWFQLAGAYGQLGDSQAALAALLRCEELEPEKLRAPLRRAQLLIEMGALDEAEALLLGLDRVHEDGRIALNYGDLARHRGDLAMASVAYEQATGLPRAPAVRALIAELWLDQGRPDLATVELEKNPWQVVIRPRSDSGRRVWGQLLCLQGELTSGLTLTRAALDNGEMDVFDLRAVGRCQELAGDVVAARQTYQEALALTPNPGPRALLEEDLRRTTQGAASP